jgi:hypothetical protein
MARGIHELRLRLQEQEVDESREIQMGLLPKTIPQIPGYAMRPSPIPRAWWAAITSM